MSKPIKDFLQNSIKSLSPDNFRELISLFQIEYWNATEVIGVDGANDGGNDLKIFEGKNPVKKCIQLTTQKLIDRKIKEDIQKANDNINKYGYSNSFEFYWSQAMSEDKINEYQDFARKNYGIDLKVYDAKILSSINCNSVKKYIYELYGQIGTSDKIVIDKSTKILYDLLSIGNNTTDIKTNLIHSFIVFFIHEKEKANISEICKYIKENLNPLIDDTFIVEQINYLRTNKRLITSKENRQIVELSDVEKELIVDLTTQANITQSEFETKFIDILKLYNQEQYFESYYKYVEELYKSHYKFDIDESENNIEYSDGTNVVFHNFQSFVAKTLNDKTLSQELVLKIRDLCSNSNHINKICATASFTSLYKSNKLENYLNQSNRNLYLDTPLIVFLLCFYYGDFEEEWNDPFYKATTNLILACDNLSDRIEISTMYDYLKEVAGELKKALKTSYFFEFDFISDLGETKNSFINFYKYLKENNLFDEKDNITDFTDFVLSMGFENIDPDSSSFIEDTALCVKEILEHMNIDTIFHKQYDDFEILKREYEISLMTQSKIKSNTAADNDLRVIRYIADKENSRRNRDGYYDQILVTWDNTVYDFRKELIKKHTDKYSFFHIYNPPRLLNKISLEKFNINSEIISNDIFAYADANYNISSKVRTLLEMIAPIIGKSAKKNLKLIKELSVIRKKEIEEQSTELDIDNIRNLPVEELFMDIVNYYQSPDSKNSFIDFTSFFCNEINNDLIIDIFRDSMKMINNEKNKKDTLYKLHKYLDEMIEKSKMVELAKRE